MPDAVATAGQRSGAVHVTRVDRRCRILPQAGPRPGPVPARPAAAATFELDVITAVILGGASLSGGRGTLWGTLIGLLLIGVINNGMILAQVPAFWQQVVKGVILLSAVLYDEMRRSRRDDT